MNDDQAVTKKDLVELQKTFVEGVSQLFETQTTHIDERFAEVDQRFEEVNDRLDRVELKVGNVTDDHEVRISKLEKRPV